MRVTKKADFAAARQELKGSVGFVPTMGFLHEGHVSLLERARAENDHLVLSLFVNPTQFGPNEDFASYPRDLARDLALAEKAGVDLVLAPDPEEMYPQGYSTFVEVEGVSERWEGARRPGHFRGVATVVLKLFNLVRPTRAYFGEKDYQQLQVLRHMVRDLELGLELVGCPTIREADGLAKSSRNTYLDEEGRANAVFLSRALSLARDSEETDVETLLAEMKALIGDRMRIDYLAIVDQDTLEPLEKLAGEARALGAAFVGKVRLIDNMPIRR